MDSIPFTSFQALLRLLPVLPYPSPLRQQTLTSQAPSAHGRLLVRGRPNATPRRRMYAVHVGARCPQPTTLPPVTGISRIRQATIWRSTYRSGISPAMSRQSPRILTSPGRSRARLNASVSPRSIFCTLHTGVVRVKHPCLRRNPEMGLGPDIASPLALDSAHARARGSGRPAYRRSHFPRRNRRSHPTPVLTSLSCRSSPHCYLSTSKTQPFVSSQTPSPGMRKQSCSRGRAARDC